MKRETNVTLWIIVVSFFVYGVISLSIALNLTTEEFILKNFGFSFYNLISRPWCILTSIFLHKNLEHLVSNMIALLFFGIAVESKLGWKKMILIFFLGAFFGELLSLLFYPPEVISIGASAGVFALIGTGMIVKPFGFSVFPPFYILPLGLVGILYTIYNIIGFLLGIGNISYVAHFGGLLTGLYFGVKEEGWKKAIINVIIIFLMLLFIPIIFLLL